MTGILWGVTSRPQQTPPFLPSWKPEYGAGLLKNPWGGGVECGRKNKPRVFSQTLCTRSQSSSCLHEGHASLHTCLPGQGLSEEVRLGSWLLCLFYYCHLGKAEIGPITEDHHVSLLLGLQAPLLSLSLSCQSVLMFLGTAAEGHSA